MVLPTISEIENKSEKANEAFNTRVMFTEIDHNYIGSPSNRYESEIEKALKTRENWIDTNINGTEYYHNGLKVFNEYLTYGVFLLYAHDIYKVDPQLLVEIDNDVIALMKARGFIKMKEFSRVLENLYTKYKGKKIDSLYPELIKWCADQ